MFNLLKQSALLLNAQVRVPWPPSAGPDNKLVLHCFSLMMSTSSVHRPCAAACSAVKQLLWCLCLFLYRADRPIVGCHLVGRGCGRTRSCVLGANARFHFETGYDGKGNRLTRLAGHMPMVGEREAICNTPRLRPAGGRQCDVHR